MKHVAAFSLMTGGGQRRKEKFAILFDEWNQCSENWQKSKFMIIMRERKTGRHQGGRRWLTEADIAARYSKGRTPEEAAEIARDIVLNKEQDPVLKKLHIKPHPDCPLRESMKLILIWDEEWEADRSDVIVESLFKQTDSSSEKDKKGRKRARSSSSSSDSSPDSDGSSSSSAPRKSKKSKKKKGKKSKKATSKKNKAKGHKAKNSSKGKKDKGDKKKSSSSSSSVSSQDSDNSQDEPEKPEPKPKDKTPQELAREEKAAEKLAEKERKKQEAERKKLEKAEEAKAKKERTQELNKKRNAAKKDTVMLSLSLVCCIGLVYIKNIMKTGLNMQ